VVIAPDDKVENWLKRIELTMVTSLRTLAVKCYYDYPKEDIYNKRRDWMFSDNPA